MTDQLVLFAEARTRRRDPDTSRDAARAVTQHAGALRNLVLEEFNLRDGLTDEELVARIPDRKDDTVIKRRCELRDLGLLVDSGERRRNSNGRNVIVWRLVTTRGEE